MDRELILKIFHDSSDSDKKGFYKELDVIKAMIDFQGKMMDRGVNPNKMYPVKLNTSIEADLEPRADTLTWMKGFPRVLSFIDGNNQAEILMEALGPNLKRLIK